MERTVLTIGYGTRTLTDFVRIVRERSVDVVCDVRTTPYSSRHPDFNQPVLRGALKDAELRYLFLGDALGARPSDPALYIDGKASYDAMAKSRPFLEGIERIKRGSSDFSIALMCAETDPFDCHRAILIAPHVIARGMRVEHIVGDGARSITHDELEARLLKQKGLQQAELFDTSDREAALAQAYKLRGSDLAYDIDAAYRARALS